MSLFRVALCIAAIAVMHCDGDDPGKSVNPQPGDDGRGGGDPGPTAPGKYAAMTWDIVDIEVNAVKKPGYQGVLVRGGDGTLFYAYIKEANSSEPTCDIAVFGGDAAPGIHYTLEVAVRAAGASTWTVETVPLEDVYAAVPYITARHGLDAVLDNQGRLAVAFAGGPPGLFTCGSGDLIIATRTGANAYTFDTAVSASSDCCTTAEAPICASGGCTAGSDIGAWAAIALDGSGNLTVIYMDYHNDATKDGVDSRGLEFWEQGGGVSGIRPYSGKGNFSSLIWTDSGPIAAYSSAQAAGVFVARRIASGGTVDDWEEKEVRKGWEVSERIRLAQAADGTLGLLFHADSDETQAVGDLVYCWSTDGGDTWSVPCETIDQPTLYVGAFPSLAYDSQSRPHVSYYVCGTTVDCKASTDGVRYAWRESLGKWWLFDVHFDGLFKSGLYTQLVLDPATDAPTVVFQDITRGAVMAAQGKFQ